MSSRETDTPQALEAHVRRDVAACYRMMAHLGWDDLIATHISARLPGSADCFLMNPRGTLFEEITASSLVKVNVHGEAVGAARRPVNRAGFVIHSAVYLARADVGAVIHLHTLDGVSVSMLAEGLLPLNQTAIAIAPDVAFHEYEGAAVRLAERERLQRDLGDKNRMMLRNHGTLAVGSCIAEAFVRMYTLERSCTIQIRALAGGRTIHPPSDEVVRSHAARPDAAAVRSSSEELVWPAVLRKVRRLDPSFEQ
jgi:ribulose-5-phosphate 4-epimerase/fuculose-1-phosphate aldolase